MNTTANSVLIVIDLQNGFLGPRTDHVVPRIRSLVDEWLFLGGDVVFTQFFSLPGGQYERLIGWKRLQRPPETDLCPDLAAFARCVIQKNYYSGFTTELKELVLARQWNTFALCGIATDSCVLKTAVDAFELGYTPIVISDACASHGGQEVHDAALLLLRRFIGKAQITDSDTFLSMHRKPVGH